MSNSELMTHRLDILSVPSSSIVLFFLSRSTSFIVLPSSCRQQSYTRGHSHAAVRAWIDVRVVGRGSPAAIGHRAAMTEVDRIRELHAVQLQRMHVLVVVDMHEHVPVVVYVHEFEYTKDGRSV